MLVKKPPISGVICRMLYTLRIMKFLCIFQPSSKRVWNYFLASLVTIRYQAHTSCSLWTLTKPRRNSTIFWAKLRAEYSKTNASLDCPWQSIENCPQYDENWYFCLQIIDKHPIISWIWVVWREPWTHISTNLLRL